jgi:hypothetical protein
MPRIFGQIPTTDELPFQQLALAVGGGNIPNGGSAVYTVGTYTMPWDGELFASFTSTFYFAGYQQVSPHLGSSIPVPNSYPTMNHIGFKNPGNPFRSQLPLMAWWVNLTRGQIITIKAGVNVGGGGNAVQFEGVWGTVRAVRVGL